MPIDPFQYDLFRVVAPLVAALVAALLAVSRTRSYRTNPASRIFALYAMATIGFLVSNTLEISATTEAGNLFWSRVIYLFIPFFPIFWLTFALRISGRNQPLPLIALGMLLIVPVLTLVFVFSDPLMFLVWSSIEYAELGAYVISRRSHGPWFAIFAVYTYLVSGAGLVIAVRAFSLDRSYYLKRTAMILAGALFPYATSLIFVFRPFPGLLKDLTPLGYGIGAFFFFSALYPLDAFAIIPMARTRLVEHMRDGILVFDAELRIADANRSALRMLRADESLLGKGLEDTGKNRAVLPPAVEDAARHGHDGTFDGETDYGSTRHYAVDAVDLPGAARRRGRLVVIRDETVLIDALGRLDDLARRDSLTELSNRRGFMEAAEAAAASTARYGEPLTVAMFDLDNFKRVNDERGHAKGDEVLRAFARTLSLDLRGSDSVGRIGGEEFALALPRTTLEGAWMVCERIRRDFAGLAFVDGNGDVFRCTVSVGIAVKTPELVDFAAVLAAADAALYRAKAQGRDKVAS